MCVFWRWRHSSGQAFIYFSNFSSFSWLGLVSCFFLYNVFLLIGRETFDKLNDAAFPFWVTLDYISDVVYLLDIVVEFMTGKIKSNDCYDIKLIPAPLAPMASISVLSVLGREGASLAPVIKFSPGCAPVSVCYILRSSKVLASSKFSLGR